MKKIYYILLVSLVLVIPNLSAEVVHYNYARSCAVSELFDVKINGEKVLVYHTSAGDFVSFEADEPVEVEVTFNGNIYTLNVKPYRLKIKPEISGNVAKFQMPAGEKIVYENFGIDQLFIFSNDIVEKKPTADHYFKAGQVYEVGTLELKSNETLYIEGGAVISGRLRVNNAKNVKIFGNGIFDGSYYSKHGTGGHFLRFANCKNITVNDIIMTETPGWMLVFYHCEDVTIDNIKQLSDGHGTDGIDLVACRQVDISNSILRNGDDCIVLKAFIDKRYNDDVTENLDPPYGDLTVKNCAVQANWGGQAFEIGHEMRLGPTKNIKFIDCDVLGVHGQGGVFGIHNCDKALVSDVLYENIRVDHYYNKLIDMRIIKSRWSRQEEVGQVKNVTLKDIFVTNNEFNQGYSISLIGGYDDDHKLKNVIIDNFQINRKKITNFDELDLFLKQTENVLIK